MITTEEAGNDKTEYPYDEVILLKKLYNSSSIVGLIVKKALDYLANGIYDGMFHTSSRVTRIISSVTRITELRWSRVKERLIFRCPECGNKVSGECGRFKCYICGEVLVLRSEVLGDICNRCESFKRKLCMKPIDTDKDIESPVRSKRYEEG